MGTVASVAGLAMALGQPARDARLLGAVAATRETNGMRRIAYAAHTERIETDLRAQLAEPEFTAVWNGGYALPFAVAVAEAREIASSADRPRLPVDEVLCGPVACRERRPITS
jgi:hypothetical protein